MSAFAVVYERSNTPVEPGVLERILHRLEQRGPDGSDVCLAGNAALGHWHFWTTPEESGERQPLGLAGMPFKIVLDGRLDNRPELMAELGIGPAEGSRLSDAALMLRAYEHWGAGCFEHFIGAYALAILDERRGELLCARDALGDRTLFYTLSAARMVAASEPWAAAGACGPEAELSEVAAAHFFALRAPEDGQTLFKNVRELLPAQVMAVNATGERTWRYWHPDPSARLRYKSDGEYAEHFRQLLENSVRCRLRSTTPVGVQMSGGLDSTSVACLAAPMLAPEPLTTISYVFDELPDCDERRYIEAVKARWGTRSIHIPCDDIWPLKDWQNWPHNPNRPGGNPYRLIIERTYQRARQEGLRVLLTGTFGDHLYSERDDWLADLIAEGRLREAGRELSRHIRHAGLRRTLGAGYLRRVGRRLLNAVPAGRQFLLRRKKAAPPWLTFLAASHLSEAGAGPAPERQSNILGMLTAQGCSSEIFYSSQHALEVRCPYRDRRLVEFILAIPAHQLYNRGHPKHILRNAMQGILPEVIRTRTQPTSLVSLFLRGREREKAVLLACFQDPGAAWRKFVRADWLSKHWNATITPENDGPEALVPWLCISYESWYKSSGLSNY